MLTKYFWSKAQLGAEWILYVLVALSILSIALILERAYFFYRTNIDLDRVQRNFRKALVQGGVETAIRLFQHKDYPEAIILLESLRVSFRGPAAVQETIAGTRVKQKMRLDKRLSLLGTVGSNAPFIGLFGTVLGIIQAFGQLGGTKLQGAAPKVMESISEALVATGVGLLVAIPAVMAFNFFSSRAKTTLARADSLTHDLLSFLRGVEKVEWEGEYDNLSKGRLSMMAMPAFVDMKSSPSSEQSPSQEQLHEQSNEQDSKQEIDPFFGDFDGR